MTTKADKVELSRLLALPAEIQLYIYELVVTEHKPLLINPACDSSFRTPSRDYTKFNIAAKAWQDGVIKAPQQPALSKVCRAIRPDALKLFYRCNIFRVRYCRSTPRARNAQDFIDACSWVKRIGGANQADLTQLYLYDRNAFYDGSCPHDLKHARREFEILGAKVSTVETRRCCLHRLSFDEKHVEPSEASNESQVDALVDRVMDGES